MTPAEAAQHVLDRESARESLLAFVGYTHPRWVDGRHLHAFADALEAVERRDIDRLMVEAPPRHGKSEFISRRFPAWLLGRQPHKQVIAASYNSDLATDMGRDVRAIVDSTRYQQVFPGVRLRPDSRAAHRWHTSAGGVYVAAGVGGAITGRGADDLLIDDPIKDREQADSPRYRQRTWDWYQDVASTRLMPGGIVIIVMTRWHEDDLIGRLLDPPGSVKKDNWVRVKLPAILDEHGEDERALWPERYPVDVLRRRRENTPPRTWSALFQQNPVSDTGGYIQADSIRRGPAPNPRFLTIYGASDYAVRERDTSSRSEPDYTEHVIAGVDEEFNLYVLDWWFGQTNTGDWIEAQLDLWSSWRPRTWFGEGGVIRHAIWPVLERRMRERRALFTMQWINRTVDKIAANRSFQGLADLGRIWVPEDPRYNRVIEQWSKFPSGRFDDAVDVMGNLCLGLEEMHGGGRYSPGQPDRRPTDYRGSRGDDAESWKVR